MTLPLQNRTILITRTQSQAPEFRLLLERLGARVLEIPTIEIRPRSGPELDSALENVDRYQWLIFTSVHSVEIFMERARELGRLSSREKNLAFPKICTIGPATAEKVQQYGLQVDLLPGIHQAEGILEDFLRFTQGRIEGLRILIPRARRAREILPEQLRKQRAKVKVLPVYDTVLPRTSQSRLHNLLGKESPDLITFTSSSTVRNFVSLITRQKDLRQFRYAAIGPITAATAREYGLKVVVQAEKSSIPQLVTAIEQYFAGLGN
jgi:uroporphyrinogen III methyltransferase / synthase